MKARYSQYDGTHSTLEAPVIVPVYDEHGNVSLQGFENITDSTNFRQVICYAGNLTMFSIT